MSGGPGGGVPECAYKPPSGFIVPKIGNVFDVGKPLNITWSSGPVQKGAKLTSIFDILLVHSGNTTHGSNSKPSWEKKLFDSKAYIFQSDRKDRDSVWTNFDLCGNTAIYQLWTISTDLNFSSPNFALVLKNVTTDTENRTYNSSPFVIRETLASTTSASLVSSSVSTPVPTITETPEPGPQLSAGAKAGIGIGVALAVIILVLLACRFWRRSYHQRRVNSAGVAYRKPELDGWGIKRPAEEIDGPEILEADGGIAIQR